MTGSLPTRRLGTTDMALTRVGFGAWAAGGGGYAFGWGPQPDEDSIAAIRHALACGVNWIDTAPVYGLGHSERVVARALHDVPTADRPYVFTKCGMVWNEADASEVPRMVADPSSLRREVDNSLRRLGVDRIDLYQVHWPPTDGTAIEDYWGALVELRAAGKIRALGLSNHAVPAIEAAERLGHVDALQPPFSALRRAAAEAEIPWGHAHGTGVIVYSPMQSGLLSGSFSAERAARLPADDWRSKSPRFKDEDLRQGLALADALRVIANQHGVTPGAIAIAWTLAWPGVTGAIVGARTPAQVDGWMAAATLTLTPADLDAIAAAIERLAAGGGPARPRFIATD